MTHGDQTTNRWAALIVLCVGFFMIVLDGTVVNVALPTIQDDLGFSQAGLAWVVNAYLIAFGGLLLLAGRFGDLVGRRRMFLLGLAGFTAASALCGVAQSQEMLIGARFVQGVAGAMASAVILGMIVTMFPEPSEQARAMGVYGFVASAGGSIGLLAGGVLTDLISWHWIFFINVPVGVATWVLARRLIAADRGIGLQAGADAPGATLVTASLMLGVYTIVQAADHGWGSARTLALGAVSLALFVAFLIRQDRAKTPLVPLRIFRSRIVSGSNAVVALVVAGMFGMFFLGALYLQRVLGYNALEVGFAFLPATLIMGAMSLRYAPRLTMRFGPQRTLVACLILVALGLALFARMPVDGSYVADVLPPMVLLGFGAGASFPPIMTMTMSEATPEDAGLASGVVNTMQQVGAALGLAILATLSESRTENLRDDGVAEANALVSGYHLGFTLAVGLVVAAILVSVFVLRPTAGAAPAAAGAAEPACDPA